jgi:phosphatidylserine decarboxylase
MAKRGDVPSRGKDTVPRTLQSLTPAQVLAVDRALACIGSFGEVRIVKAKGRVRFIERLESEDLLRIGSHRGDT